MDPQTLIFEISSDDEIGFDSSSTADNFDWITKLLEDDIRSDDEIVKKSDSDEVQDVILDKIGGEKVADVGDDDDDVVVVGEVIVNPRRAKRSSTMDDDGDDDDCVMLECNPDKKVSAAAASTVDDGLNDCEGDEDDLVIVSEKGQVACRDFPHSRHQCVNFPFSSTPHESRCDLCHCYVCDSLAPCAYWGTGASSSDHCHATDKVQYWQHERKRLRLVTNSPLPYSKSGAASMAQPPQLLQAHARPIPLSRPGSNRVVPMPCGVPNIIHRGTHPRARNYYQPHLVSQQLSRTCTGNVQSNRSAHLSPRMVTSRPIFKRPGFTSRPGVAYQATHCSPNNVSVAYMPNQQLAGKPIGSHPAILRKSSPEVVVNASACQPNLHLRGHGLPSPHTPTSRYQGGSQSTAVMSDSPYIYSTVNHTRNVISPVVPLSSSGALNGVSQSSQQSVVTQNLSGLDVTGSTSDVLSSLTQSTLQPSVPTQKFSSPVNLYNASVALNSVAPGYQQPVAENSQVQCGGATPNSVPSMEQDILFDFEIDSWLQDNQPEGSFFEMNSQPSPTAPIDTGMLYFDFETSWKGLTHL